jgi:hypothetical protein
MGFVLGSVLFPFSYYISKAVYRDLNKRFDNDSELLNCFLSFMMMVLWVMVSLLAVDSLLGTITMHTTAEKAAVIRATTIKLTLVGFVSFGCIAIVMRIFYNNWFKR